MNYFKLISVCIFSIIAQSSLAMTYFLTQDLGVSNNMHNCKYSNNRIYSVNATTLCPMQVDDDMAPATQSNSNQYQSKQHGFKTGEYMDGMTKVCVYNVLGKTEAIRIGNTELCPLGYDF